MFAIRDDRSVLVTRSENTRSNQFHREYINQEDLTKAARKVGEAKKHESKTIFYILISRVTDVLLAKMEYSA
jgi:ribosomal protein S12 methylthiotransferase accessory factor YcaO